MNVKKVEANVVGRILASWGRKGGKNRARALTPRRRSEIASMGAAARWKKAK